MWRENFLLANFGFYFYFYFYFCFCFCFYLPTTSQNSSKDVHGNSSSRYVANTRSEAFNMASSLCLIYSAKTDGHWLSDNTLTFCDEISRMTKDYRELYKNITKECKLNRKEKVRTLKKLA